MGDTEQREAANVRLAAREVEIARQVDVLVVGAGPSGVAASVGAAQTGVKVLLLEQSALIGGVSSCGLYLRMSGMGGEGVQYRIVGGVAYDFVRRVLDQGGGVLRRGHLTYDYEAGKRAWDELVKDAGVDVLFHTIAFEPVKEGDRVVGVLGVNKAGLRAYMARVVVDASGDGDVAARSRVPFQIGRPTDGLAQPVTMMMRFGGVDIHAFSAYYAQDPRLRRTMAQAASKGDFELFQDRICSVIHWAGRSGVLSLNVTNQRGVNGTDPAELSAAVTEGRRQVWVLYHFLKKYVPGFEHAWVMDTAPTIGVRETRRILGEYVLTKEDVLTGREFPDNVALGSYPIDIHRPDGLWVDLTPINAPCYGIPFRCLVPRQVEGLLVAGRNISATHEAIASARVMFTCMAVGHAAGVAAALASRRDIPPRRVDLAELRRELLRQGAILTNEQARILNAPSTLETCIDAAEGAFRTE